MCCWRKTNGNIWSSCPECELTHESVLMDSYDNLQQVVFLFICAEFEHRQVVVYLTVSRPTWKSTSTSRSKVTLCLVILIFHKDNNVCSVLIESLDWIELRGVAIAFGYPLCYSHCLFSRFCLSGTTEKTHGTLFYVPSSSRPSTAFWNTGGRLHLRCQSNWLQWYWHNCDWYSENICGGRVFHLVKGFWKAT